MRIINCRRAMETLAGCTALALAAGASAQTVQVETFTGSAVAHCTMPGSPSGGKVNFTSSATLQTLDFSPGSVFFNGAAVDFDGHEAAFLSSPFPGTVTTPVLIGPATVTVTGVGTGGGFGGGGGGGCMVVGTNVPLGNTFSSTRLDVTTGPGIGLTSTIFDWSSGTMSQLNGHQVSSDGPINVTSVDAVNGIVNFSMSGRILVGSQTIPALTTLGFLGLAIGLFGLAVLALSRKTARGSRSSA